MANIILDPKHWMILHEPETEEEARDVDDNHMFLRIGMFGFLSAQDCDCMRRRTTPEQHGLQWSEPPGLQFVHDRCLYFSHALLERGRDSLMGFFHYQGPRDKTFHVGVLGPLDPEATSIVEELRENYHESIVVLYEEP